MKLTLEIENLQDLYLILNIIHRIGVKIIEEEHSYKENLAYHYDIISKGVTNNSFGDPVAWQKEIRTDRKLPLRG